MSEKTKRLDPLGVKCPLCGAAPRRACRDIITGSALISSIHPSRAESAYTKVIGA